MEEIFKPGRVRGAELADYATALALIPIISFGLVLIIHFFMSGTVIAEVLFGPLVVIFAVSIIAFALLEIPYYTLVYLGIMHKTIPSEYVIGVKSFTVRKKDELIIPYTSIESVSTMKNKEYSTVAVDIFEFFIRDPVYIMTNLRDDRNRKLAYVIGPENRDDFIVKIAEKGVKVGK